MTTQADVDEIKAALAAKRAGRAVVKVASGGRSIEYDKMTVEQLEQSLAKAENEVANGGRAKRAALKPYF